jgi:hypothetical protein
MTNQQLVSVQSRPSTGHPDLPAIAAFYERCDQVDYLDNAPSLANLQRRLDHPPPDGSHQRQLWETAEGQLVGLVSLWLEDPTDVLEAWVDVSRIPGERNPPLLSQGVIVLTLVTPGFEVGAQQAVPYPLATARICRL